MKISGILLNTSLYSTETIIVQTDNCSRFSSLPRWMAYFLKLPWKRKLKYIVNNLKKNIIHSDNI